MGRSKNKLSIHHKLSNLDDLVLDTQPYQDQKLLIGYAHNVIDILDYSINDRFRRVKRIHGPETCCLFSLHLTVTNNEILVANGTVFGKLFLWKIKDDFEMSPLHTFTDHEGVIFRITMSVDQSHIATVSDDRSVRIWSVAPGQYRQTFIGWGHVSRVRLLQSS